MVAVMKDLLTEQEIAEQFEQQYGRRPGRDHLRLVPGAPAVPSPRRGAPRSRRSPSPVRRHRVDAAVYRRRRLVAAAVLVIGLVGAVHVVGAFGGDPLAASGHPAPGTRYVVHPGDTIWSIARDFQPTGDPRPLVDVLVSQHGGTAIDVGDVLQIPAA